MSIFSKTSVGLTAAALTIILGGAKDALAQTQTFSFSGALPGSQVVKVSSDGGSSYEQGYAGRYHGTLAGDPINIFCVDISHVIHTSDTYMANTQYHITDAKGSLNGSYYAGGLASAITTNDLGSVTVTGIEASHRASQVAWLADNYLNAASFSGSGDTDLTNNLTAVSLSIWDIVRDGGNGLTSGQVQAKNLGSLGSLVSYYEALAGNQTAYQSGTAMWIQAPLSESGDHLQDYVYVKGGHSTRTPQPVPEPGVPTMLLCLGLVAGAVVVSRKRRMTAS
jgi:hypothetical protein